MLFSINQSIDKYRKTRYISAVHEAGHIFLLFYMIKSLNLEFPLKLKSSIGLTGGRLTYSMEFINYHITNKNVFYFMGICLAGRISEDIMFDGATIAARQDLSQFYHYAETALGSGMGSIYFSNPKSDFEKEASINAITKLRATIEADVYNIIRLNKDSILYIANKLHIKKALQREELISIYNQLFGIV